MLGDGSLQSKKYVWCMLLITISTIFINLGSIPLLDPDEPVYGETPKEMIQMHDFISPRIFGEVWYDKPPIYYWLVVVAFKLFGVNEFSARFPSAVLAVFCVFIVYKSTAKLFNQRAGIISGLVLATSFEYFYLAKAAVTDITLTLFLTASLLCFLQRKYYLFYLFSALATLTKGPIGLLFPGVILFIWMAFNRRFSQLKQMKVVQGIFIWAVVALPWYGAMYYIHGADFVNGFLEVNNIIRFTTAEHAKTSSWYFFIPVLILGFFPWATLLFQVIKSALNEKGKDVYPKLLFFYIWALFIFVFFSISSTKLVSYILPAYPPLAILVGWYLDSHWEIYQLARQGMIWPILLTILLGVLVGSLILLVTMMPAVKFGAILLSIVFFVLLVWVWCFLYKKAMSWVVWGQAGAMAITSIILFNVIVPTIVDELNTKGIAREFVLHYDGTSPVYVIKFLHPGFAFYTDIYGKEIRKVIFGEERAYMVIRQSEYQVLSNKEKACLKVLSHLNNKLLLLKE